MNLNLLLPLGLALGATLPVVVIFYLLKVRRHDEEISSTFLWNDLIRDLAAHEPLQRLRWNVLLVLQLIALGLLTLALARPFNQQTGAQPVHAVFVLDGTASMQATDVTPSRFARAIEMARAKLAALPDSSLSTVILAAAHPQVLISAASDARQVDKVLTAAQPSGAAGDMREALLLARSLGGDPGSRRIYLFTDGAFNLPTDLPDDLGSVEVVQVAGPTASNLAVTSISSRPDARDNRRQQVFARVENFSSVLTHAVVTMSVDGQATDERQLDLDANGSSDQVFDDLPAGARAASVSVSGSGSSAANGLALDDTAYTVLVQRKTAQVLLVSSGNQFLEKVLSLLPNLDLYRIDSQRYLGVEADRYDVVVFDAYQPPLLPRGNLLIVNPTSRGPIQTSGQIRRPRVGAWDQEDPLLAFVDIRDLTVSSASKLELPRWAKPLITATDGTALLAAGQDGDRRVVMVPFDLRQSNLPLSPAFPILMSNIVSYLSPPGVVQAPSVDTGLPESLVPLPQVETVRVTGPGDQVVDFKVGSGPITYATTDVPGLYRVQQLVSNGQQTVDEDLFAANLVNREESDIRPRLTGLGSSDDGAGRMTILRKELWALVAAIALPLLLFEWFWFHRKV
jgi:Ca-activated chloride channel family protein